MTSNKELIAEGKMRGGLEQELADALEAAEAERDAANADLHQARLGIEQQRGVLTGRADAWRARYDVLFARARKLERDALLIALAPNANKATS